ncbi:hypothetical protein M514_05447 [Trichuris suis]|uniref:Uncharacterized protein n=1 Tax=Trichuris suis TaxID=68888 RepID=A0A085NSL5_9BILA|nr:hypothetical protein M513_05447 [Trichuris suis]KFD72461.1 hypothetical protein M514_05447 [Trichuris suis]
MDNQMDKSEDVVANDSNSSSEDTCDSLIKWDLLANETFVGFFLQSTNKGRTVAQVPCMITKLTPAIQEQAMTFAFEGLHGHYLYYATIINPCTGKQLDEYLIAEVPRHSLRRNFHFCHLYPQGHPLYDESDDECAQCTSSPQTSETDDDFIAGPFFLELAFDLE